MATGVHNHSDAFIFAINARGERVVQAVCGCGYKTGWHYSVVNATTCLRYHVDEANGVYPDPDPHPVDCMCGDTTCPNGINSPDTAFPL